MKKSIKLLWNKSTITSVLMFSACPMLCNVIDLNFNLSWKVESIPQLAVFRSFQKLPLIHRLRFRFHHQKFPRMESVPGARAIYHPHEKTGQNGTLPMVRLSCQNGRLFRGVLVPFVWKMRVWKGGGGGGTNVSCQLKFWAIYQLSVNWLLIINHAS